MRAVRELRPRRRLSRHRGSRCGWHGSHLGRAAVVVDIAWPCGHSQGLATPTCTAHLDHLLVQGGQASLAVPCPMCQVPGRARVVGTHDIKATS